MVRVLGRFGLWTVICLVSAGPSFFCGAALNQEPRHLAAMLTGILLFVIAYTVVTSLPRFQRIKQARHVKRTLYIGYGTRLFISIVYPIGLTLDIFCGLVSIAIVQGVLGDLAAGLDQPGSGVSASFLAVLVTTLVQGTFLNIILAIYMSMLYGLQCLLFGRRRVEDGRCAACGYDLRASNDRCPECGAAVVVPATPPPRPARAA